MFKINKIEYLLKKFFILLIKNFQFCYFTRLLIKLSVYFLYASTFIISHVIVGYK